MAGMERTGNAADGWAALLRLVQAGQGMGPFAIGLCRMTLRVLAERRDFVADLDSYLGDYRLGMIAAGIDPDRASATLAELRELILEEWHSSRPAAAGGA